MNPDPVQFVLFTIEILEKFEKNTKPFFKLVLDALQMDISSGQMVVEDRHVNMANDIARRISPILVIPLSQGYLLFLFFFF